ncbi:MAG: MurR/RpiR family transcriptional regulator, partial [Dorea sp.]|nr:MurR/RpiR family transcriptional regulator [Dorea sp.]
MDIIMRIEEHYPSMTKKQRQISDYIKENIDTMTFITLRELSKELGVTEITILNTCKALGYKSFNEMKYEVRKYSNINQRIDIYQKNEY